MDFLLLLYFKRLLLKADPIPILSPVDLDKHHFGLTESHPDFSPFYPIFHIYCLEDYPDKITFPQISEIAYKLTEQNSGDFGRFFKSKTGTIPRNIVKMIDSAY